MDWRRTYLQQNQRNRNVGVQPAKIIHLYLNWQSIIPKVEVAGSIPVSRSGFILMGPILDVSF
jgi:hypothetical protein